MIPVWRRRWPLALGLVLLTLLAASAYPGRPGGPARSLDAPAGAASAHLTGAGVVLEQASFQPATPSTTGKAFTRIAGTDAGFERLPLPRPYQAMEPGVMHMGALAAGDVNADGWPDVAVGTHFGVYLYANTGGRFALQEIAFPAMREWIAGDVALVDLDGDGALDLFFTTWMHGSHILYNRAGSFSAAAHTELPRGEETAAHSAAFADVDRDGDVDVVTGATTHVPRFFYPAGAVDRLWRNDGAGGFRPEPLPGPEAQALTLLFHDVDNDGWPDLFVGNDYDEPDRFFHNDRGTLRPLTVPQAPLPVTPYDTMSADSGDIDNDGRDELYLGGIAPATEDGPVRRIADAGAGCRSFEQEADREQCTALARFQQADYTAYTTEKLAPCKELTDTTEQRDCVVSAYHWNRVLARLPVQGAGKDAVLDECRKIPSDFTTMHDICRAIESSPVDGERSDALPDQIPQVKQTNLLFAPEEDGFSDVTRQWGVGVGGWTWNAKFADIDNDGWQDLYVAQGSRLREKNLSASLYRNKSGSGFEDIALTAGLEDFTPTGASLFLDYDVDGDLDLITHPFLLTPVVWRNDAPSAPGWELQLDDRSSGNRHGIGARVEISSADGRIQARTIKASGGYQSHDALVARFGLGDWPSVAHVRVVWPDGATTELSSLSLTSGRYTLTRDAR